MTRISDISSLHWQPALDAEGIVTAEADIHQCLRTILRTPKGSDPHRPEFGSNIHLYIDHPTNQAIPHLVREAVESIRRWEPRCTLVRVTPRIDAAHITLRIIWRLADGVQRETAFQV